MPVAMRRRAAGFLSYAEMIDATPALTAATSIT
jgi:hypothetical protein